MTEVEIKKEVERQFDILSRGCEEIINEEEFKKKLEKSQIICMKMTQNIERQLMM